MTVLENVLMNMTPPKINRKKDSYIQTSMRIDDVSNFDKMIPLGTRRKRRPNDTTGDDRHWTMSHRQHFSFLPSRTNRYPFRLGLKRRERKKTTVEITSTTQDWTLHLNQNSNAPTAIMETLRCVILSKVFLNVN